MTEKQELEILKEKIAQLTSENQDLHDKNELLARQVELLEHTADLVSLVDQPLFAIIITAEGRFLYTNQTYLQIVGYEKEKIFNLTNYEYLDYIHPEDRALVKQMVFNRDNESVGVDYNFLFRILTKSGEYRYMESWSRRIFYRGKIASLSTLLDVTDKQRALEELKTNQLKYKTIFENSPIGIYYSDVNGEMGEVNETTVKILGSPSKEATQNINLFTFPLLVQVGFSAHLRECIASGKPIVADTDYVTKWGKRVWLRYYLNPIFKNDQIDGALINFVDITEAKSAELALRQNEIELRTAIERAEESNRLKTTFLENMNHEIRTPLNGILGFLDLCKDESLSHTERCEYIEIVDECASQLLSIISDILEASTISSGKMSLNNRAFSPQKLIDYLAFYFDQVKEKRTIQNRQPIEIKTVCNIDNESQMIIADHDKIQQILTNLLNNALKFTHKGYIEFGCSKQNKNELLFYVKDTGIGIEKNKHSIIFERFRQADETLSKNYGGTGLGLTICKSLVDLMGGKIWVESEPEKGSCFSFSIPFSPCNEPVTEVSNNNTKSKNIIADVLLVDDVCIIGEYCKRLVNNTNIRLHYVSNGHDAVKLCKKQSFDLILMDLQMPLIDGYDTLKCIQEEGIETPVIAVSAHVLNDTKEKIKKAGFKHFLPKPFKRNEFLEIISMFINEYHVN